MTLPLKAIPTRYRGVNFRSRLEARWAAYFDLQPFDRYGSLNTIRWEYEPYDFDGWIPDFKLYTGIGPVFVEVKPVNVDDTDIERPVFAKAIKHWKSVQVLLLGKSPYRDECSPAIGVLTDPPPGSDYSWRDIHDYFIWEKTGAKWREAANRSQWNPPSDIWA